MADAILPRLALACLRYLTSAFSFAATPGRTLLAGVPDAERERLLRAVAEIYSPDRVERRRLSKINDRRRKAARVKQDQSVLATTGIWQIVHLNHSSPPAPELAAQESNHR